MSYDNNYENLNLSKDNLIVVRRIHLYRSDTNQNF